MNNKQIRRIAFSYTPETCPAVDLHIDETVDSFIEYFGDEYAEYITSRLDELRELIKADGTILLREGMISAIVDYEERIERMERDGD